MENDRPQKSNWYIANIIVGIVGVMMSCFAGLWLLSVIGIVGFLIMPLTTLFVLIPVLYKQYRNKGKFHKSLLAARITFVILLLIPLPLPYIGVNFEHDSQFYVLKKFIYTYGVYDVVSDIDEMLPKHLPDDYRDYKFKTQLGSIAQDYHPSAYLMFHTDSGTISGYEERFEKLTNCEKKDAASERLVRDKNNDIVQYAYPEAFPDHVFMWLDDVHKQDLLNAENAVIYRMTDTYYGRGCLIDYDSGLVVYWT